ncbi:MULTISPECIES: threonine ammonia-lyase IlvA [unclassified Paracoccus (in: a-proteobacteria)]|uniref:threonine ammonia-lyase IlvA n=1 Tax=unclassified Paracoccus (in: a-proteobacteria) TaxID=2688777 RepID=UPI0012B2D5AC|nr:MULTISPECIES: threonine ammonia-lyase IlvA [unclassified Paracoccus (in: a-proteobacteria)]UXU75346.1 threonine ammonia-lyase IlvA [Paracoccus sp. SMMA_5]UXU81249.1 threonine ammonia-lyase IlvA [Paracoccus sp. SMMA_5_TC]
METYAASVRLAQDALRDLFEPTPLQRNDHLSARYGAEIWLKREDLTPVRSYKLRGAYNAMRKIGAGAQGHFVCASAGNHAQGMAFACRHFGARGTIFMPVTTPRQKIDKTRIFGGDSVQIVLTGDYFDQTLAAAQGFARDQGATFLSPFDDADIIEGQATVGAEILQQLDSPPDLVVLPVGGGGLAAGVTRLLAEQAPATRIAFAEPLGGPSLHEALRAGHPVTLPHVDNFVDGAAVARIGDLPFQALGRFYPDQVHLAPEDRICGTILEMLNLEGIVLEPAGALAIDVLRDIPDLAGQRVVCVCSGGNFDFERLPEVKERAQRFSGLKRYFILRMPQRPGALRDFLQLLGPDDDIARFEYLKKTARNFGSVLIGIETTAPENLDRLRERLDQAGIGYRDITHDPVLAEFLI